MTLLFPKIENLSDRAHMRSEVDTFGLGQLSLRCCGEVRKNLAFVSPQEKASSWRFTSVNDECADDNLSLWISEICQSIWVPPHQMEKHRITTVRWLLMRYDIKYTTLAILSILKKVHFTENTRLGGILNESLKKNHQILVLTLQKANVMKQKVCPHKNLHTDVKAAYP